MISQKKNLKRKVLKKSGWSNLDQPLFLNFFNAHLPFSLRKDMSPDLMRFDKNFSKNRECPLTQVKSFAIKLGFIWFF